MKSIASELKQCPFCIDVMQSVCSKAACKYEGGVKPRMILVHFDEKVKTRKGLLKRSIETFECKESNSSDDYYGDCIPNNKES